MIDFNISRDLGDAVVVLWGNCKTLALKREDVNELAAWRFSHIAGLEYVRAQFENDFTAEDVRSELKETGAWGSEEMADDDMNRQRLLFVLLWNNAELVTP